LGAKAGERRITQKQAFERYLHYLITSGFTN
jgi:hypothetical protein